MSSLVRTYAGKFSWFSLGPQNGFSPKFHRFVISQSMPSTKQQHCDYFDQFYQSCKKSLQKKNVCKLTNLVLKALDTIGN